MSCTLWYAAKKVIISRLFLGLCRLRMALVKLAPWCGLLLVGALLRTAAEAHIPSTLPLTSFETTLGLMLACLRVLEAGALLFVVCRVSMSGTKFGANSLITGSSHALSDARPDDRQQSTPAALSEEALAEDGADEHSHYKEFSAEQCKAWLEDAGAAIVTERSTSKCTAFLLNASGACIAMALHTTLTAGFIIAAYCFIPAMLLHAAICLVVLPWVLAYHTAKFCARASTTVTVRAAVYTANVVWAVPALAANTLNQASACGVPGAARLQHTASMIEWRCHQGSQHMQQLRHTRPDVFATSTASYLLRLALGTNRHATATRQFQRAVVVVNAARAWMLWGTVTMIWLWKMPGSTRQRCKRVWQGVREQWRALCTHVKRYIQWRCCQVTIAASNTYFAALHIRLTLLVLAKRAWHGVKGTSLPQLASQITLWARSVDVRQVVSYMLLAIAALQVLRSSISATSWACSTTAAKAPVCELAAWRHPYASRAGGMSEWAVLTPLLLPLLFWHGNCVKSGSS